MTNVAVAKAPLPCQHEHSWPPGRLYLWHVTAFWPAARPATRTPATITHTIMRPPLPLQCCKNKLLMSSRPPTNNANNTSPSTAPASPSPAASPAAQPSNGDSGTDSSNTADSANSASDSGSIKRAVGLANGVAAKLPLPGAMGRKLQAWP